MDYLYLCKECYSEYETIKRKSKDGIDCIHYFPDNGTNLYCANCSDPDKSKGCSAYKNLKESNRND
jgi:hypothetical protein